MRITLKDENAARGESTTLERRIVGSTDKFLFLRGPENSSYSVLPLDAVRNIVREPSNNEGQSLICLLAQ
jgi:hypothetical protein